MARIRTIKPEFFKNEEIAELPALTRLLFIGLWTQADREGRIEDRPKRLKAELFPYDNYDVDKGLNELQSKGFIHRYEGIADDNGSYNLFNQVKCICIINFIKHQKIDNYNEKQSQLPEYQCNNEQVYKKTITSLSIDGEGKGKEGKGREINTNVFIPSEEQKQSFKKFQDWLYSELPEVSKMAKPFTVAEYVTLIGQMPDNKSPTGFKSGISKSKVVEYLQAIENNKTYLKKYRSPYLCVLAWHKKDSRQ